MIDHLSVESGLEFAVLYVASLEPTQATLPPLLLHVSLDVSVHRGRHSFYVVFGESVGDLYAVEIGLSYRER